MNIALLLQRAARAHPHAPALAHGTRVLADYATASERVARLAAGLTQQGLAPGARVALVMKNHPAYFELLMACWHAGLVAVPIHSKLHPKELAFIFENSGAGAVFATGNTHSACIEAAALAAWSAAPVGNDSAAIIDTAPSQRQVFEVSSGAFAALFAATPMPLIERGDNDLAWLFYTSGTTGRPKGVMLSHGNLMAMTLNYFTNVDNIAREDCIIHAAAMSHGSGIYLLPHVAQAACNVITESGGFEPDEIAALCQHYRGVTLFAAPTMVKRLVEAPLRAVTRNGDGAARRVGNTSDGTGNTSNGTGDHGGADPLPGLKTIVYGGGPMYVADLKAAIARFGQRFVQIYGQGESPMTITASNKAIHCDTAHPRYGERLGSVGLPFAGVEVMVADEHDRPLPAGVIGEICVRGPVVMQGYWANPAATAKALAHGWLHTGDMGAFDDAGFLTLKDRSKDLIISGGSNIYPREVEEALLTHPLVAEVSVVGRAHAEWGEEVIAFVVARRSDAHTAALDAAMLDAHCIDNIARFKRPKQYRFVDSLPKNETGKVLKTELRKLMA